VSQQSIITCTIQPAFIKLKTFLLKLLACIIITRHNLAMLDYGLEL